MATINADANTNSHFFSCPAAVSVDGYVAIQVDAGTDLVRFYKADEELQTSPTITQIDVDGTVKSPGLWWEQWTPHLDNPSDLMHLVWADSTSDLLRYCTIDITDGTIGTISTIVDAGVLDVDGRECCATVTVSQSGRVHVWWIDHDGTNDAVLRHWYSDDVAGSGWTEGTSSLDTDIGSDNKASSIYCFPANTSDGDDCGLLIALSGPTSTSPVVAYAYDSSADTLDNRTVVQARSQSWGNPWGFFGASYSTMQQKAYAAVVSTMNSNDVTGDLYSIEITGTDTVSVTNLGNFENDTDLGLGGNDDLHHPTICCDDVNDLIYICYAYFNWQVNTTRVGYSVYDIEDESFGTAVRVDVSADDYRATSLPMNIPRNVGGWVHFVYYDDDQTEWAYDPTASIEVLGIDDAPALFRPFGLHGAQQMQQLLAT